jgi:hypothetical protein
MLSDTEIRQYCGAFRHSKRKDLHKDLCVKGFNDTGLDLGEFTKEKWRRFIDKLVEHNGDEKVRQFLRENKAQLQNDFDTAIMEFGKMYDDALQKQPYYSRWEQEDEDDDIVMKDAGFRVLPRRKERLFFRWLLG